MSAELIAFEALTAEAVLRPSSLLAGDLALAAAGDFARAAAGDFARKTAGDFAVEAFGHGDVGAQGGTLPAGFNGALLFTSSSTSGTATFDPLEVEHFSICG